MADKENVPGSKENEEDIMKNAASTAFTAAKWGLKAALALSAGAAIVGPIANYFVLGGNTATLASAAKPLTDSAVVVSKAVAAGFQNCAQITSMGATKLAEAIGTDAAAKAGAAALTCG